MSFFIRPFSSITAYLSNITVPDEPTTPAIAKYPIQYSLSVAFSTRNPILIKEWIEKVDKPKSKLMLEINNLKSVSGWIKYAELDWRCFVDCPVVALVRYGKAANITDCLQVWCLDKDLSSPREYLLRYVSPIPRFVPLIRADNTERPNTQYLFEDPHNHKFESNEISYYLKFLPLLPGETMREDIVEYTPEWDLREDSKVLIDGPDRYKQVLAREVSARLWGRLQADTGYTYFENKNKIIIKESVKNAQSLHQVFNKVWTGGFCADLRPFLKNLPDKTVPLVTREEAKNNEIPLWRLFTSWVDPTLSFITAIYLYLKEQNPLLIELTPVRHLNEEEAREALKRHVKVDVYINVDYLSGLYKEKLVRKHIRDRLTKFNIGYSLRVVDTAQNAVGTALWLLLAAPYVILATRNSIPHLERLLEQEDEEDEEEEDGTLHTLTLAKLMVEWFKKANYNPEITIVAQEFKRITDGFAEFCQNVERILTTDELSGAITYFQGLIFPFAHFIQPYPFQKYGVLDQSTDCFCKLLDSKTFNFSVQKPFKLYAHVYKSTESGNYHIEAEFDQELLFGKSEKKDRKLAMSIYTNSDYWFSASAYPTIV